MHAFDRFRTDGRGPPYVFECGDAFGMGRAVHSAVNARRQTDRVIRSRVTNANG